MRIMTLSEPSARIALAALLHDQYEAFIKMLNAKVAYAKGRKLVDDQFESWFRECIKSTTSAKALDPSACISKP